METLSKDIQEKLKHRVMNILIVDDRPENLLTLESIIEKEGRNVIKASGGNEALRLAIREDIGLILLDIQMPDIDGIEVAGLLRSNSKTRHIPIVFVSAVSRSERPVMSKFEEGTVDCLYKPLDLEETKMKVAFFEKLFHSNSEKRQLEALVEKNSKHLEQFIYIVSHDLKAPLRAIENLSNWISDDLGNSGNPNTNENLLLLKNRVARMSSMLEGILDYSRCSRLKESPVEINVHQLVHSVFESIEAPGEYKLFAENLPVISAERTRMYKIFYVLIQNAIIHHHKAESGVLNIRAEDTENGYNFYVIDNGPGIKLQYFEQVFELFNTLKSKDEKETTGVGLAVAKKLIEDAGGKIWIDSKEDHGTAMIFNLPLSK